MGFSPQEWLVTESFVPLPPPTYQLLKQKADHPLGPHREGNFQI